MKSRPAASQTFAIKSFVEHLGPRDTRAVALSPRSNRSSVHGTWITRKPPLCSTLLIWISTGSAQFQQTEN